MNEPGWAALARTRGIPYPFCDKCPGIFNNLSESGPRLYVSSEGRHLPQPSVPVTALRHQDLCSGQREECPLLATNRHHFQQQLSVPSWSPIQY